MPHDTVTPTLAGSPASVPTKPLGEVISIDQALVQKHLGEVVRTTVQDTLNALLDAEADRLCGAKRYEHSPDRVDTRAGHYERQLHTKAGEVTLQWRRPTIGSELKGYHLYRGNDKGQDFVELTTAAVNALQAIDRSAEAGQTYTYFLTSEEWSTLESNVSSNTLVISVTADNATAKIAAPVSGWDTTAPPTVEDFHATKEKDEPGQFRLSWKKNPANDLRYYNIYFSSKEKPAVSQKRLIVSPLPNMTEYLDWSAPLEGGAHYAITAVDRQGNESAPTYADVP